MPERDLAPGRWLDTTVRADPGRGEQKHPSNPLRVEGIPLLGPEQRRRIGASCNGQQASSPPHALDSTWDGQVFDFHGGIYNQIDFTHSTPAEDGSACIISQLSLSHA